jgi:hypothetical protein
MWDPIVAPSFDAEGKRRYLSWLEKEYSCIDALNKSYQTTFRSFDEMEKEDYWFTGKYKDRQIDSCGEGENNPIAFVLLRDNRKWQRFELREYFKDMRTRFSSFPEKLYLKPVMTQWSYFLNIDGTKLAGVGFADLWDTAVRGIDIYELAPYVDCCYFITVPVTPSGDPDAYIVVCQHSMIRCMNKGRDFLGGIYWGRYLYNDLYQTLTPCEIVGSIAASGASGISAYGMNGLDDGGLLDRMDRGFQNSLTAANKWFKKVVPQLKGFPQTEIAILFPSAMEAYEPLTVPGNDIRRLDMLGWYKSCCDAGFQPDIIDLNMAVKGALKRYKVLILSANSCYFVEPHQRVKRQSPNGSPQGAL